MRAPMIGISAPLMLAIVLGAAGCHFANRNGRKVAEPESRSVALGDAKEVEVEIRMGAGELTLGGGAKELLDAEFSYENSGSKPEVDYRVTARKGRLSVRQPGGGRAKIRLRDDVPMGLEVSLGAGRSELSVGSLALRNLDVKIGLGECTVDLAGDWKEDFKATIKGGIGRATVRLPEDTGVRVRARGGIGEIRRGSLKLKGDAFVNDAYGKSPVTLDVVHISFLNPAWEPSDVRHHLYSCGYERDEDALEVETQWVRNKTSPFSSLLMPR